MSKMSDRERLENIWHWYQNLSPELVKGNHWIEFEKFLVPPILSEEYTEEDFKPSPKMKKLMEEGKFVDITNLSLPHSRYESISDTPNNDSDRYENISDNTLPRTKNREHKWFYTNSRKRICEDCGEIQFFKEGAWY